MVNDGLCDLLRVTHYAYGQFRVERIGDAKTITPRRRFRACAVEMPLKNIQIAIIVILWKILYLLYHRGDTTCKGKSGISSRDTDMARSVAAPGDDDRCAVCFVVIHVLETLILVLLGYSSYYSGGNSSDNHSNHIVWSSLCY